MLHDDDLDAAIGVGIVTQAQADALRSFAIERRAKGAALRADEERFRFMRGFNDFFFAIGVVLLGGGVSIFAGASGGGISYLFAAVLMWALAELLIRRMRMVLPGIAVVIFFVIFVASIVPVAAFLPASTPLSPELPRFSPLGLLPVFYGNTLQIAVKVAIAALAAAVFYARFLFPFALLIVAGGTVLAADLAVGSLLLDSGSGARLAFLLLCGIVVFGFAMRFDVSDRLRATRRSDCAFWLHVLAAPLLVHSLIGLLTGDSFLLTTTSALIVVAVAIFFTGIALVIDRRALLVSALVYLGAVIAYALSRAGTEGLAISIATLVLLGALVLAIGLGWGPLRRSVLRMLPAGLIERLPPAVPA